MPLTYRDRGSSGTQLDIVVGRLVIGTLWKAVLSATTGGAVTWRWTFHTTAAMIWSQVGKSPTWMNANGLGCLSRNQWKAKCWRMAAAIVPDPECLAPATRGAVLPIRRTMPPGSRRAPGR